MASIFEGLFSGGSIPSLQRAMGFAQERHRLILENIANADTPGYRRKDLDVGTFNKSLAEAARKEMEARTEGERGAAVLATPRFRPARDGESGPDADLLRSGILRHDGNNVNLEMELAVLARNSGYHNQMAALLRKSFEAIRIAIAGTPPSS